jgi:hypothetical protein
MNLIILISTSAVAGVSFRAVRIQINKALGSISTQLELGMEPAAEAVLDAAVNDDDDNDGGNKNSGGDGNPYILFYVAVN